MAKNEKLIQAADWMIMDALVALENDEMVAHQKKNSNPVFFAKQFRTVSIGGRRQIGHSSYIKNKVITGPLDCLAIVATYQNVLMYGREFGYHPKTHQSGRVISASTLMSPNWKLDEFIERQEIRNDRYDIVFVDGFVDRGIFDQHFLDGLYCQFAEHTKLFVLMQ